MGMLHYMWNFTLSLLLVKRSPVRVTEQNWLPTSACEPKGCSPELTSPHSCCSTSDPSEGQWPVPGAARSQVKAAGHQGLGYRESPASLCEIPA